MRISTGRTRLPLLAGQVSSVHVGEGGSDKTIHPGLDTGAGRSGGVQAWLGLLSRGLTPPPKGKPRKAMHARAIGWCLKKPGLTYCLKPNGANPKLGKALRVRPCISPTLYPRLSITGGKGLYGMALKVIVPNLSKFGVCFLLGG